MTQKTDFRNIAIIAHVDHGKTTLVDNMLKQSGTFRENQQVRDRAMDKNDLERERGITILAKCTSIKWHDYRINIVDTPGHADFGGEVERILSMIDGVVVLVDAAEGPLPQTKFVLSKALKLGLRPIVVINKIDRSDARAKEVLDEVFDLFLALDAADEQLDFPILFASGRNGWAIKNLDDPTENLSPLFDLIVSHVPCPKVEEDKPFSMLVTTLESDPYLGRLLTGKIETGTIKANLAIKTLSPDGQVKEQSRATKILCFRGLERVPTDQAIAGDIIAIAGLQNATVADTICAIDVTEPLAALPIDPPTLEMTFSINTSPLAGLDGDKVTSRLLRDRLFKEAEGNVAIRVRETADSDSFDVAGRGELQLSVLIETMRREGYELSISRPRVLYQTNEQGQKLEPVEEVVVDVDDEFSGTVVNKLAERRADLTSMTPSGHSRTRLIFHAPSRGLIGYHSEFMTDTRGTGLMNRLFLEYQPFKGNIETRRNGVLISNDQGKAVAYALFNLQDRGPMIINPGDAVYEGMIIGEHSKGSDLEVNVLKGKQLTNIRAAGKDEAIKLTPPLPMTLEKALTYIDDDELVEVTPKAIRIRKKLLDPNARKRAKSSKQSS